MAKSKNIFNKPVYLEMLHIYNIDVDYVYELYKKEIKRQKELGNNIQVIQKYLTAEDIWKYDEIKNSEIINVGYDIIIIWESEYNKDKEQVIKNTIEFIKDRYNDFKHRREF